MDILQYLTEYVNEWRSSNNITYSGKLETTDYILGLSTMKSDYNTMMNKTFSGTTTYGKMIEKVQSLSNRNRSIISELIDALRKK